MKVAGIKVNGPEEARRVKWILGVHAGAAACGGLSLGWLIALILFTSHEGECGGYEVQHDSNLGKWHTAHDENFYIGYVCERSAALGCLKDWSLFQGSCYAMVCESSDYNMATEGCKKRGSHLVSISSDAENKHVLKLCGRQSCWIGLSRHAGAALWQWSDGSVAGWPGNWTSWVNFDTKISSSHDRACLNKGPPERFIEEPVFIIKAVVDGFFAACLFAEMVILIFRIMKGGPWIDIVAYVFFLIVASCGIAFCCACSARVLKGMREQMKLEKAVSSETESMMHGAQDPNDTEEATFQHGARENANTVHTLHSVPLKLHRQHPVAAQAASLGQQQEHAQIASSTPIPETPPTVVESCAPVAQVLETMVAPQPLGNAKVDLSSFDNYDVEEDATPQQMPPSDGEFTMEPQEHRLDHL